MKRFFFKLAAFAITLSFLHTVQAQTQSLNVVTTAVPFLRISPDARAGGMGELGVATSADANSAFYNLAKTPCNATPTGIGVTYSPWLKDLGLNDVYLLAATGFHKLDENGALSASIRYFSLGNIPFTDYSGNSLGTGRPWEMGADLGYSRKLSDKIGIGLTLRYIHSDLAAGYASNGNTYKPGNAVAADISFFYNGVKDNGEGWRYGVALSNLGSKIGYTDVATEKEFIPANLGVGVNYTTVFDEQNKLSFGLDINKLMVPSAPTLTSPPDAQVDSTNLANYHNMGVVQSWFQSFGNSAYDFSLGAEYGYNNQFFLRAGYFYEGKNQGDRQYFTVGIGLYYEMLGLNFSYLVPSGSGVTRNPLSNTIRFGLVFNLDAAKQ
jgi:Type IX secretion system protein PorV